MDFASSIRRIFIFQSDGFCFLHNALEVSGILFRFIQGTYQAGLMVDPLYMINFFVSGIPMGFVITWVYLASDRSILACMVFHLFVNFMQEKIAMTPETKCVETLVVTAATAIIVLLKKDMFFETRHVGRLLETLTEE